MRRVYRIECEKGHGLYYGNRPSFIGERTQIALWSSERCPCPRHDGDNGLGNRLKELQREHGESNVVFGFPTKLALRKWMQKRAALDEAGRLKLKISQYKIPREHVAASDRQCVFVRSKAELVDQQTAAGDF